MATVSVYLIALLFVAAGVNHFVMPEFYLKIMPPYLPWHRELVALSGVAEILLGLLILPERTRWWAGWGLILLLIAVFPANIETVRKFAMEPPVTAYKVALWLRLPLQLVLIWWVGWACRLWK